MRNLLASLPTALLLACAAPQATAEPAPPPPAPAMLPARTLHCTLGHALNLDPSKFQTIDEIRYEGAHAFALHLPAVPVRQGPPPEPTDDPEPIAPGTRVLSDPDGIAADMKPDFYRVIDLWPKRVEMISLVEAPVVRLIIISDIDEAKGTANLFTTRTVDAASMDIANVYQGGCTVEIERRAEGGPSQPTERTT